MKYLGFILLALLLCHSCSTEPIGSAENDPLPVDNEEQETNDTPQEEEDPGEEEEDISFLVGTYDLIVLESNDPSNLNGGTDTSVNVMEELECFQATITLHEDRSSLSESSGLALSLDPDTELYIFDCGEPQSMPGSWNKNGDELNVFDATYTIMDGQLIIERDPDTQIFHLVVYEKQ